MADRVGGRRGRVTNYGQSAGVIEETALTLNGKKSRIRLADFHALATALGLVDTQWKRLARDYAALPLDRIGEILGHSSLSPESQERYRALVVARSHRLFGQD